MQVLEQRWDIEIFFGWWKQHLNVYPLVARTPHGLMAQILGVLITYLLLAIYCHEEYHEKVNITRVRELRIKIRNELAEMMRECVEADVGASLHYMQVPNRTVLNETKTTDAMLAVEEDDPSVDVMDVIQTSCERAIELAEGGLAARRA